MQNKKDVKGFSLIEILIAVAITAVIAVTAFSIMNQALNTQESAKSTDETLAQLQRAMNRLSMDFQQVVARRVRNEFGDVQPVVMGDKSDAESFVALTRQGKRNPANLPRTEMERVIYRLQEDDLVRQYWAVLDIASEDQIITNVLLEDVVKFEVEFYADESWLDQWPPQELDERNLPPPTEDFPQAVKLLIEHKDLGEIRQIYYFGVSS